MRQYLQKTQSLPTGLLKNNKITKYNQTTTAASTNNPSNVKLQKSFSHQDNLKPYNKLSHDQIRSILPQNIYSKHRLSQHAKNHLDNSFNSINSKIQNQENKSWLMKKQSIYLYIKKYLNHSQTENKQENNTSKRYAMYRQQNIDDKGKNNKNSNAQNIKFRKSFLPKVNYYQSQIVKSKQHMYNHSDLQETMLQSRQFNQVKHKKKSPHNSKILSSRKRVNQMLKRDKQIRNLHKNCHHSPPAQSPQTKKSSPKKQQTITQKFQTLDQGIQVNPQQFLPQPSITQLKKQIKQQIISLVYQKLTLDQKHLQQQKQKQQEQKNQELERQKQKQLQLLSQRNKMKMNQQLDLLYNRQNELSCYIQKIQSQNAIKLNNLKQISQLKQIIDNKLDQRQIKPNIIIVEQQQSKVEVSNKQIQCTIDQQYKQKLMQQNIAKQRLRQQQIQNLKYQINKLNQQKQNQLRGSQQKYQELERIRLQQQKRLQQQLKNKYQQKINLLLQQREQQNLQNQQEINKYKQLVYEQEIKAKQIEKQLFKQKNKYDRKSLKDLLAKVKGMNQKTDNIFENVGILDRKSELLKLKNVQIAQQKQTKQKQKFAKKLLLYKTCLQNSKHKQSYLSHKVTQLKKELKQKHKTYKEILQLKERQQKLRKQKMSVSHTSLRNKVLQMEKIKEEIKAMSQQLQGRIAQSEQMKKNRRIYNTNIKSQRRLNKDEVDKFNKTNGDKIDQIQDQSIDIDNRRDSIGQKFNNSQASYQNDDQNILVEDVVQSIRQSNDKISERDSQSQQQSSQYICDDQQQEILNSYLVKQCHQSRNKIQVEVDFKSNSQKISQYQQRQTDEDRQVTVKNTNIYKASLNNIHESKLIKSSQNPQEQYLVQINNSWKNNRQISQEQSYNHEQSEQVQYNEQENYQCQKLRQNLIVKQNPRRNKQEQSQVFLQNQSQEEQQKQDEGLPFTFGKNDQKQAESTKKDVLFTFAGEEK